MLLFTLSCFELNIAISPSSKKALSLFVYVFLVLQMGLRWETGTDWDNYLQHFQITDSFSLVPSTTTSPELGYNTAVWLIKLVFSSYSSFLVIHAAVYYYLVFNSIKRYTEILFLPLMLFYCVTIGFEGSNRELIAVAIGLYAFRYIYDGKLTYYYLLAVLACMFHYSAILLFLIPLFNQKLRPGTVFTLLTCSIAFGVSQLPQWVFSTVSNMIGGAAVVKAVYYLGNTSDSLLDSGLSIAGLVKRLVLLTLFYYNRRALSEKLGYYNIMLNAYTAGVVLYFLFANSLLVIVNRGDLYFNVLEPLLLASQVYLITQRSSKLIAATVLCVLSFIFFFQSISPFYDLFMPYSGLVINRGYYRTVH